MKTLSVVGTAAMFLVGGSILVHGLPFLHHMTDSISVWAQSLGAMSALSITLLPILFDLVVGLVLGSLVVLMMNVFSSIKAKLSSN
jgi:predicted DNA repair protein MutK